MLFRYSSIGIAALLSVSATVAVSQAAYAVALVPDYSEFESYTPVFGKDRNGNDVTSVLARVTTGLEIGKNGSTGGAFSEFSNLPGLTEINFDSDISYSGGKYSSQGLTFTSLLGFGQNGTNVKADNWAPANPFDYDPANPNLQKNTTDYLAVFQGNSVEVSLGKTMNYFGINWGALSNGNRFILKKGNQEVARFDYSHINPVAPVKAKHQNNEGNAYLHLYAEDEAGLFDTLVLEQTGGGGFEVDNFSYVAGDSGFEWDESDDVSAEAPEPGLVLGVLTVGGLALVQRRKQVAN